MHAVAIPENRATKALVATLCGYEFAAITTGRLPTITVLDKRSRHVIGGAIVVALAIHFFSTREALNGPQ